MKRRFRPRPIVGCMTLLLVSGMTAVPASALNRAIHALSDMTPVTDQGDTLQCWAVAIISRMDVAASRRAGFPLKLSAKYLLYAKTKAEIVYKIRTGNYGPFQGSLCETCADEPVYYQQGGIFPDAVETAKLLGVMPESAYPGFPQEDQKLFRALNALFDEYAHDKKLPRDEKSVSARVEGILDAYLGVPPESFEFGGIKYDARSFFAAYMPDWQNAGAIELNYWPGHAQSKSVEYAFNGRPYTSYWTGNQTDVFRILEATLKAHEPALLAYWYLEAAHERDSIGFHINGVKLPAHFNWNDPDMLDHYVLALKETRDRRHNVSRIYVKNTFGISAGEGYGFNWMEKDYFAMILGVEISDRLVNQFVAEGLLSH